MTITKLHAEETSSSVRLIAFDEADIHFGINPNIPLLFVSGQAPCANMEVRLEALIYAKCPEYWGIELVGQLPGDICLTAVKPFNHVLALYGITGSKGIELIAANGKKRFDVAGGCSGGAD